MTIQVVKLQRATLCFDRNSTVLDLIQALTENLGGEWDDARLEPDLVGNTGGWRLVAVMDSEEPNRPERWETEDGEHVAVVDRPGFRTCCCEFTGTDEQMDEHLQAMAAAADGETEDGEHVAVWNATQKRRQCSCGAYGTAAELEAHLKLMAGDNG